MKMNKKKGPLPARQRLQYQVPVSTSTRPTFFVFIFLLQQLMKNVLLKYNIILTYCKAKPKTNTMSSNSIDYALRIIESIAFSLHAILGLTEPWTGCLRRAFHDNNAMPNWFWPVAGLILLLVAYVNLAFSANNTIILVNQAYIASFHMGAVIYHRKLGHHPAVGFAPGIFVLFAFGVVTIRANVIVALIGTVVCTFIAMVLAEILVTTKDREEEDSLLEDHVRS
jgi:hypothetical protein